MTQNHVDKPIQKKEHSDLFRKASKGGFWVFAIRVFTQVLSVGRYIILMNVLKVEDMGLLGIALLMMGTLNRFSNTGFDAALVQKKEDAESFLDTAWTIGIIRALVLFSILFVAAPAFVSLKALSTQEASLTVSVIRVLGLSFLIGALSNNGILYFQKELQFRKQFVLKILPTLISIAVSVVLVIIYKSIWSLVIARLSANIFSFFMTYAMHPFRPRINFDMHKVKQLWSFGKWVFSATIIGFLISQGDDYFVWFYFVGSKAFALYQAAYRFANIPATEITHVVSQVSFPAYSKLQDDIPRLRQAYFKIIKLTACLSVPVSGLIFILAPEFVELFLKPQWHSIAPVMRIMIIAGMLRSIGATTGPLFLAVGKPDISPKAAMVSLVFMASIIYPLTKYFDIEGTAMAFLATTIFVQPIAQYFTIKILHCNFWDLVRVVIAPMITSLLAVGVVYITKEYLAISNVLLFLLVSIEFVLVYICLTIAIDKIFNFGIIKAFKEQILILSGKKK